MRLALTDPLTGLGNHRHFTSGFSGNSSRRKQKALPLSLCLIDVDDFKRINDDHGHPHG